MSVAYERVVDALRGNGRRVLEGSAGARAQCPAHGSHGLTLALRQGDGRVQVHCFAGCDDLDVLAALKLGVRDLFDKPRRHTEPWKPRPKPNPLGNPMHWCGRAIQQQRMESKPTYWLRRARELEEACQHQLGRDGCDCCQTALACRRHARLLAGGI